MSKIMGGIAIGLVVAASALLGVAETYPYELLNSDTSAKLLGGFIVAAAAIGYTLFLPRLTFIWGTEKKRKTETLYLLRESGPMEGPKLVDFDSVSLTAALMHLQNGGDERIIVSDGKRVLVVEADGSWKARGIDRDSIATAVERDDPLP